MASARPAPDAYPVSGSQALSPEEQYQPELVARQQQQQPQPEPVPESPRRAPYQPALFSTRDLGRVVPIQAYQARAAERRERAKQAEASLRKATAAAASQQSSSQTGFSFEPAAEPALAAAAMPGVRSGIASSPAADVRPRVADPVLRAMAAAADFGITTIIAGLVCLSIWFGTGGWTLPGAPYLWFGGFSVAFALIYKLLWAAFDTDSPGLAWCHLQLEHYDARRPRRQERFERIAWALLSIVSGALGLVWALVDQEKLCWHDHSSKTFLTTRATRRRPGR